MGTETDRKMKEQHQAYHDLNEVREALIVAQDIGDEKEVKRLKTLLNIRICRTLDAVHSAMSVWNSVYAEVKTSVNRLIDSVQDVMLEIGSLNSKSKNTEEVLSNLETGIVSAIGDLESRLSQLVPSRGGNKDKRTKAERFIGILKWGGYPPAIFLSTCVFSFTLVLIFRPDAVDKLPVIGRWLGK